jgi:hypothetical protein
MASKLTDAFIVKEGIALKGTHRYSLNLPRAFQVDNVCIKSSLRLFYEIEDMTMGVLDGKQVSTIIFSTPSRIVLLFVVRKTDGDPSLSRSSSESANSCIWRNLGMPI